MKKAIERAGWFAALLFIFYWQFLRNKKLQGYIAHMNWELDKANDHIFALTIECNNLIDEVLMHMEENEILLQEAVDRSEFTRELATLHAAGFYQQVAFNDDAILFTRNMAHIPTGRQN
jgi:hypothetical protein